MADVCMTGKQAVGEHKKLVRVLKTGSRKQLRDEAKEQSSELSQYRKKARQKPSRSSGR